MKKIVFLLLVIGHHLQGQSLVTTGSCGGRFGDQLLHYLHAKWISYRYSFPLLYNPFQYSSELWIDREDERYDPLVLKTHVACFLNRVSVNEGDPGKYIYFSPYFPEAWQELEGGVFPHTFTVDWKDPKFREIALNVIQPIEPVETVVPPTHTVNIAMHIREGGGHDGQFARLQIPLKLPPLSFYIEALEKTLEIIQGKTIYCYVFTDAKDPESLVNQIRDQIGDRGSVLFDYRKENNAYNRNVLEDFFSLFAFDIMIRPQSNFSIVPCLLKDYALVIAPGVAVIEKREPKIIKIEVESNDVLLHELLRR